MVGGTQLSKGVDGREASDASAARDTLETELR
ncbi:MAG: hypothetical protein JWM21_3973 [Acidobacteria bacterium]|nr:hypothetical protein [Acidobacteriota bacterium]